MRTLAVVIVASLSSLLSAASDQIPSAGVKDSSTSKSFQRIVSLNGSTTELLYALGFGPQVVGRDESSYYPDEVNSVPSVGYQFMLSAEGILSLKPDLVIGRDDAKPVTVLEQVKTAGAHLVLMKEPRSFDAARAHILEVGELLGAKEKAEQLAKQLDEDVAKLKKRQDELKGKPEKKLVCLYLRGPMVAFLLGDDSGAGSMIRAAGLHNSLGGNKGTPALTAESLAAAQPDVLVTYQKGLQSVGGIKGLIKLPGVAQTPAGRSNRVVALDDIYLGSFGPRCGRAALDLLNGVYSGEGLVEVNGK